MPKLTMLRGLPASGKTTWAKEQVERSGGRIKRVNKDDLRTMIDAGKWSREREKNILHVRDSIIITWLVSGFDVLVDDTNYAQKHKKHLEGLAQLYNADFEVKDFNTSITECIKRDLKRENSVGEKVISDMYFRYVFDKKAWVDPIEENKSNVIIVDLDGTLAIHQGRSPYDFSKISTDSFNYNLWYLIKNQNIIFISGREGTQEVRKNTIDWLKKYTKIESNDFYEKYLLMRAEGDNRKDSIVKAEIYNNYIEPDYNVVAVFDDRSQVVDMWRSKGLLTLQINYGDF